MFKMIKRWLRRNKTISCKHCVHKKGNKDAWFCDLNISKRGGIYLRQSICGNKKPQTTPKWCPLIQKGRK